MSALSPPATILVTGANGYVGCWAVRSLLEKGYTVLGAVRTQQKAQALFDLISAKLPSRIRSFDCIVVPDITVDDAFDPFLEGVHGIVHTATPVTFALEDPEEYIRPAVDGTMGILKTAAKHQDVKRIVVTSSTGAIAETILEETRVYTEDDWNDFAVEQVQKLGKAAIGWWKYDASKVLAERAAYKFYEDNKSTLSYDLSTIVPCWILGPLPDDPPSPSAFTTPSPILEWKQLFEVPPPAKPDPVVFNYVDIRDVTEMHVRALELPEAAGQRFTAVSQVCTWQDWFNAALEHDILPSLAKIHPVVAEDKDGLPPHPIFSNEKSRRLLGMTFKTIPETLRDLVADFRGRGFLKHLEEP